MSNNLKIVTKGLTNSEGLKLTSIFYQEYSTAEHKVGIQFLPDNGSHFQADQCFVAVLVSPMPGITGKINFHLLAKNGTDQMKQDAIMVAQGELELYQKTIQKITKHLNNKEMELHIFPVHGNKQDTETLLTSMADLYQHLSIRCAKESIAFGRFLRIKQDPNQPVVRQNEASNSSHYH